MKCPNCGAPNPVGAEQCEYCGTGMGQSVPVWTEAVDGERSTWWEMVLIFFLAVLLLAGTYWFAVQFINFVNEIPVP